MLITLHYCFLGKVSTGGVAAKRGVLNIAMNPSTGFASSLKEKGGVRRGEGNQDCICMLRYTFFI